MKVNATYFTRLRKPNYESFEVSEEEMAQSFARCLKGIRQYKKLTLKQVSEATEIPFQSIARYENGENIPSVIQAYKLGYFYHMELDEMFRAGYVCESDRESIFAELFPEYDK